MGIVKVRWERGMLPGLLPILPLILKEWNSNIVIPSDHRSPNYWVYFYIWRDFEISSLMLAQQIRFQRFQRYQALCYHSFRYQVFITKHMWVSISWETASNNNTCIITMMFYSITHSALLQPFLNRNNIWKGRVYIMGRQVIAIHIVIFTFAAIVIKGKSTIIYQATNSHIECSWTFYDSCRTNWKTKQKFCYIFMA